MRVLTVSEFEDWCRSNTPAQIIYASSNQQFRESVQASLRFDRVIVCPELRRIWFGNGNDSVFFNTVKEVHMFDDVKRIGTVFDIVCERPSPREFRLIADK